MTKTLLRRRDLVLSVIAGAFVTVLVSWLFALNAFPQYGDSVEHAPWPASPPEGWPATSRYGGENPYLSPWGGFKQWSAWGNHDGSSTGAFTMTLTRSGWPMLAMESVLTDEVPPGSYRQAETRWANEPGLSAGLFVPFHWSRPHTSGARGWGARRLPLRPLPVGFAVNTACAAVPFLALAYLWRLRALAPRRSWAGHPAMVLLIAMGLNVVVSLGVWSRWQLASKPRDLQWVSGNGMRAGDSNAMSFNDDRVAWPATVPYNWPDKPRWIGSNGEALGVRIYEYTSRGIPSAAVMWLHVTWAPEAFDPHQTINLVQAGWPFPSLQSEELLAERIRGNTDMDLWNSSTPLERTGAVWNLKLPGAPEPIYHSDPMPIVPIRPLPLGTVANTLIFSLPLALLLWLPSAVRIFWRRRKAQCLSCGYDVKQLPACPECGPLPTGSTGTR